MTRGEYWLTSVSQCSLPYRSLPTNPCSPLDISLRLATPPSHLLLLPSLGGFNRNHLASQIAPSLPPVPLVTLVTSDLHLVPHLDRPRPTHPIQIIASVPSCSRSAPSPQTSPLSRPSHDPSTVPPPLPKSHPAPAPPTLSSPPRTRPRLPTRRRRDHPWLAHRVHCGPGASRGGIGSSTLAQARSGETA